jgi:hypothetical protein
MSDDQVQVWTLSPREVEELDRSPAFIENLFARLEHHSNVCGDAGRAEALIRHGGRTYATTLRG